MDAAIPRSISRERLVQLPIGRYGGKIVVVATQEQLDEARADLESERLVGLDTETRPSFTKGESHPPALVQLATARAVYLFQLRRSEWFHVLAALFEDPRCVKAGVSLKDDLRALKGLFTFEEQSMLDLGLAARRAGLRQTGLRNLAGIVLGFRIPKGAQTSNWAARDLTPAQITYAATDAWACRELCLEFRRLGTLRQT